MIMGTTAHSTKSQRNKGSWHCCLPFRPRAVFLVGPNRSFRPWGYEAKLGRKMPAVGEQLTRHNKCVKYMVTQ